MSRKACRRQAIAPQPPRGLRPRLTPEQIRDLELAHLENLDGLVRPGAGQQLLWDFVEAAFTWHFVAVQLQTGVDEMAAQLELATRLVERWAASGRIGFTGVEYQVARRGIDVMTALAETTDRATAVRATEASDLAVTALQARWRAAR